jgi:hypothetical protein
LFEYAGSHFKRARNRGQHFCQGIRESLGTC